MSANALKPETYEVIIRSVDKVLHLRPHDARAWNVKGKAHFRLDRYEDAIKCFDKVIEAGSELKAEVPA